MEYKKLIPQEYSSSNDDDNHFPASETESATSFIPSDHHFLSDAVFAGGSFWSVEAAYGRIDGVVKTVTGYCGGTLTKPTYSEVCEGRTGHTEAVKVTYDNRKISYRSLCNAFWETHDPTNKDFLNFGISTHQRSVIFYKTEEERKQGQESKIRRQMKLNRRIITKFIPLTEAENYFFNAENQHQKYYLQKHSWLCQCLSLRSTNQFVDSSLATKLNGILGMDGEQAISELAIFLRTHKLTDQTKSACEDIIEGLNKRATCATAQFNF